jgi:hypothetical protein
MTSAEYPYIIIRALGSFFGKSSTGQQKVFFGFDGVAVSESFATAGPAPYTSLDWCPSTGDGTVVGAGGTASVEWTTGPSKLGDVGVGTVAICSHRVGSDEVDADVNFSDQPPLEGKLPILEKVLFGCAEGTSTFSAFCFFWGF